MSEIDAELERMAALYGTSRNDSGVEQLRVPPQATDAEQSVLGGLMLAPEALVEVREILSEDSFYRRDHQLIWRAIIEQSAKERPFDAVTLSDWFDSHGLGEQVADGSYLIHLASTTPSAANIRAYAQIVADKARLRRLIEVGTQLVNDGFEPQGQDSEALIGKAQTQLSKLLEARPCELEEMGPVLTRMFENLQRRYELRGALDGLSTGLSELDRVLNGLKGGRVYVLAARPKMGKTTLALNVAEAVGVAQEQPVSIFSFEMQPEELTERLTCSVGRIEHDRFRRGCLEDEDWSLASSAVLRLKRAPIRLSRPRNVRIETLVAQAHRLHARFPQKLIVVDYLQLLDTKGAENRTQGISEVSRQLKMLAIDLDVPVLVLSQLNRDLEKRTDKRPVLADLRDSGAIEQDADAIIFIYRDEVYHPQSPDRGTAEIIIAAHRNGPTDTVRVASRLNYCRFDNLADDWRPDFPAERESKPRGFRRGSRAADRAAGGDA